MSNKYGIDDERFERACENALNGVTLLADLTDEELECHRKWVAANWDDLNAQSDLGDDDPEMDRDMEWEDQMFKKCSKCGAEYTSSNALEYLFGKEIAAQAGPDLCDKCYEEKRRNHA